MNPREALWQRLSFTFFRGATLVALGILLLVLALLIKSGGNLISWDFLTKFWQHRDITAGGIFPAIYGSLLLGLGVMLVSFPLGVGTAIYLTEYQKHSALQRIIQLAIRNLAGVPSVVYGLFGLAVFVGLLRLGTSLAAAILTLAVMTLPWVITATVEALASVPQTFREASLALGASQWQTITKVVLPLAIPGSITGGIIGIARAMGETAPIIIVGATFYLAQLPTSPLDKFMALPYHTFILATQHASPQATSYAAATAIVLVILTVFVSLGAILVRYAYRRRKDW